MYENNCKHTVSLLQAASKAREAGLSCADALLEAYRGELGDKYQAAVEMAGRLPDIMEEELCDVFAVTFAIITQLTGADEGYAEAAGKIQKKYNGCDCGCRGEETALCTMRMKDCILLIECSRWEHECGCLCEGL